ncbi:T4 RnlA family RNA ligase [Geminocystis sp. GBBB08]|uniref:T4 RnlA family RNA ligase n=1 Tax=Geminocystis sp. GBBB08 TaxID=2604140 RepID=UPI0027E38064|nr:T4 RnlA family RNA ligase [Geminocystis sp. GBBB08]MBL1210412.1 2'-5' RNA ligase [Geminocystis sp. GBBB08]
MELQEYLRQEGLEQLINNYYIKVNRHQKYPNLVCLKYSQIESPMSEKIVQQSRGIILDESNNWEIVSYAYDKFFNYSEPLASEINWNHATVYDKLDGSLMVLYYYNNQWQVQSSGTADASGEVGGFSITFAQLFWQVWQELNYSLPKETDHCFVFEMLTPYNRIVVQQNKNNLVLHGVRNIKTLQEKHPQFLAEKYGFNLVRNFPLQNWQQIQEACENLNPLESEGYVICDYSPLLVDNSKQNNFNYNFNRVKVKSPRYVAWAHFSANFSTRKMLEIIVNNEGDEFLAYYPEWTKAYQETMEKYYQLIFEIEQTYQQYQSIPLQKDFALAIKDLPYSGLLFALRNGKSTSIKEALTKVSIQTIEQLLGLKYIQLGC